MLETLRKQGASIIIYAVFGILIAVFVINFGAQSVGTSEGCRTSASERVIVVDGHDVNISGWRWVQNMLKARQQPAESRGLVAMEWLIQREILVDEAESRGLYLDDDMIDQNLEKGRIYFHGGPAYDLLPYFIDRHGIFIYEPDPRATKGETAADDEPPGLTVLARNFGMSMASFKEQQRKETLAAMMHTILAGEPRASIDEARASWLYANASVDLQMLEIKPKVYADAMLPTDGELDAWAKAHDADAKAAFAKPTVVHVHQLYLPKGKPAAPAGSPPGAITLPPDATLGAARSLLEGGKKLDEVAKMGAADAKHPLDLGWRAAEDPGLGSSALDRAVTEVAPQGLSKVVALDDGFYLLQVDTADKPTYDKLDAGAKRDFVRQLARAAWGDEEAKRVALAALDKAKTAKSLSDIYPPLPAEPAPAPTGPVPSTPAPAPAPAPAPIKVQPAPAPAPAPAKTGRIEIETPDVPAVWGADDVKPPAGGAVPVPAGAPVVPAAPPELKASTEALPAMTTVTPHTVVYAEVTRMGGELPFELTPELSTAIFEQLGEKTIAPRVFQVGGEYVLVDLVRKNLPDDKIFEKSADQDVAHIAQQRGKRHYEAFLRERCNALAAAHKISDWNPQMLTRDDGNGHQVQLDYHPCFSLDPRLQGADPSE